MSDMKFYTEGLEIWVQHNGVHKIIAVGLVQGVDLAIGRPFIDGEERVVRMDNRDKPKDIDIAAAAVRMLVNGANFLGDYIEQRNQPNSVKKEKYDA